MNKESDKGNSSIISGTASIGVPRIFS